MTDARRIVFNRIIAFAFTGLVAANCDGARALDGDSDDVGASSFELTAARGAHGGDDSTGPAARHRGRGPRGGRPGHGGRGGITHCPGSGGTVGSGEPVAITPDETGWVDGTTNSLGVQGNWFPFADGHGPDGSRNGECQGAGHADAECTVITTPDPAALSFPNVAGKMCTSGTAAQVLNVNGVPDYSHMWGGGIGLDLAVSARTGGTRGTFDAPAHAVIGLSFDIDAVPLGGLRVQFPTPTTDAIPVAGPDYWGATETYPPSPVRPGTNVVMFTDVRSPEAVPQPLDVAHLEGVLFLVPASVSAASDFSFCISNVKMLRR